MTTSSLSAPALRRTTRRGWRRGLSPLIRKEFGEWFGTRRWLVQLITWIVIVNGVVALVMLAGDPGDDPLQILVLLGMFASGMGAVVTTQGAVVGEKQRGTAAWILSKPASRTSFLLAKVIAHTTGFVVFGCLVPCVAFLVETWLFDVPAPSVVHLSGAAGLWALHLLVYVSLTVALGALFDSRGPIASIGSGLLLAGQFFSGMLPLPVLTCLPWVLPKAADAVSHGEPFPASIGAAVTVATGLVLAANAFGLWRLHHQEL